MAAQVSKAAHVLERSSKKFRSILAWGHIAAAATIFVVTSLFIFPYYEACDTTEDSTKKYEAVIENQSEKPRSLNVSTMMNFARSYCTITGCTTIKCSSIPVNLNPGKVAANYIESVFKVDCTVIKSITLIFDNCQFPENVLQKNWLETDVSVDQLSFESCSLSRIDDDAFALRIYEETRRITIENNKISSLSRATFQYFQKLQEFKVQENTIRQAEFDLLADVAGTLEILQLDGAIDDPEVLRNITGGSSLSKVQMLSIRDNSIPIIDREIFAGLPKVRSLYIERSEVKIVLPHAFQFVEKSLALLTMNDNDISTLPEGLFDSILQQNQKFSLTIDNNPWHCNCSLKWMQEIIKDYPTTVNRVLTCKTPSRNALLTFSRATFCDETSPSTKSKGSTTRKYITSVTSPGRNTEGHYTEKDEHTTANPVVSTCDLFFETQNFQISHFGSISWSKFPSFFATELANGSVLVSTHRRAHRATLFWFDNDFSQGSSRSINCVPNVTRSYAITNVLPETTYTVCMSGDLESDVSPFNCLGLTTRPNYEDRTWMSNGDKGVVFSLSIATLIVLCLLSVLATYVLLRTHPTLLRGSKRVMIVKRRNFDAIVLPKGVEVGEGGDRGVRRQRKGSKGSKEDGYVTPLPPARPLGRQDSRVSRMSLQSDGMSYVSGIEPTLAQLASWRALESCKVNVPPLPPHPHNKTPSSTVKISKKKGSVRAGRVCTM